MMRHPGVSANDAGVVADPGALPEPLAATVERVATWGGDVARYRAAAAAGLAALDAAGHDATAATDAAVRALGTLAAWRSGIPAFRRSAHEGAGALPDAAVAAVLGIGVAAVADWRAAADDPLFWPGTGPGDEIVRVGGFRGLGGAWTAPPAQVVVGAGEDLAVRADGAWWRVELDAVGVRLHALESVPLGADAPAGAAHPDARLEAAIAPDSYLVTVRRRA
ncbi:hypothetical protein [Schumannella sp. 10F1B-5-1]|uniref:hypothetical protein n=1 Tax=Schumannella sp. 10F1B-5-1 TaxID=2590780 RepID=UPI00113112C5|nr:hypothetical protein [Schumannella sp. 10F1B-5-1]TPW70988.1 hypothetical protein FJ658_12900 [Schumannella sp. 10F1B-5-1]